VTLELIVVFKHDVFDVFGDSYTVAWKEDQLRVYPGEVGRDEKGAPLFYKRPDYISYNPQTRDEICSTKFW